MKLSITQVAQATGGELDVPATEGRGDDAPYLFSDYLPEQIPEMDDLIGDAPLQVDNAEDEDSPDPAAYEVCGFSWDSRAIQPGWLYVALPGERVDGHDFAEAAVAAGATAVLATRPLELGVPVIVVDDTAAALSDLARYWRDMLHGTVIGLTGSSGKTTTKNLVRDVLACAGSVVATEANQNNELGVPRTLLMADPDTHCVVVEMGMRGLGEITQLTEIARPKWGIITNVGESHIELLGSRENIARAKAELFEALPEGRGIAFMNADDDFAAEVPRIARLNERGVRVVYFSGTGTGPLFEGSEVADSDELFEAEEAGSVPIVWASDVSLDGEGRPSFTLNAVGFEGIDVPQANGSCPCAMKLRGLHNVSNACSAAAVGLAAGLLLDEVCQALAASEPEQGRQQVHHTAAGVTVVDDSYNANPDSMKASLATFSVLDVPGRRIAVLGDMLELGESSAECHRRVGGFAAEAGLDRLICVGELSRYIAEAACAQGIPADAVTCCADADEALDAVQGTLSLGDAVLVKASHSIGLERVVEGLVS